ncbi:MAG: choice-of-anchor D domain-containing protein, partial [Calditrichaeota bacterium]
MKPAIRLLIGFLGIWLQAQVVAQPIIAVSPTSIDYGNIALPGDSTAAVEIFNFGTADLIINALQITGGDSDQFSLPNPPILPLIIPPGAPPETVAVRFSPSRTGLLMGAFRILSNDSLRDTLDVPLRGVGVAPQIQVTPDTLRFGRVVVNGEKILPLEITNVGNLPLVVDDTSIVGNDDSLFHLVNPPPLPISIPPGGPPVTLSVRFHPTSTGAKSAFLVLTNNDPLHNPRNIPLRGTGVVPDIAVSHTSFSFGSVIVGEDSSFILQISNIGLGDLIISDLDIVGGGAQHFSLPNPPTLPDTIPPGGDPLTVEVQFAPLARGSHAAFLTITSNDPDQNPLFVNLDGVGIKPDIVVSPATLQFDTVRVGGDELLDLVIRNLGDAPLVVSDAQITGPDSAEFSIASMPSLPFTVSTDNDSAVITLRFSPASAGIKQATLQLTHNDVDRNPLPVPLQGAGVEPDIAVFPLSLDFGDVLVNTTDTLEVFILNEGGITLRVDSLRLAGPDAEHFGLLNIPPLPLFLPPGGLPIPITVIFTPDTVRTLVANLLIFGNDPDENPLVVGLTGNGVKPVIGVTPPALDFGNVRVNFSLSLPVQISNLGTAPLVISDTAFSGADADLFSVVSMPPLPFVIDVDGEPVDILIRFQPDSVGPKTALFQLSSNDPDTPTVAISLSGTGVAPDITTADTLDFGRVRLGSERVQELPVINRGTDFLTVFFADIFGPDFLQFKFTEFIPFPLVLAPGDTFIFSLSYTPDTLATQEATLEIFSDDPDTPLLQVNLRGTGALPHIAVDTTTVNFGTVKIGGDSLQTVQILNIGGFPLQVNEVRIVGEDSAQFQLADLPPTPFSVGPDGLDSVGIGVRYRPTESARHQASLEIISDDSLRSPLSVPLKGRGVQAPTILEFSLSEVRLNTDLQINATVTADTTIEIVRVHFADNATPGFPNVVVLDTLGGGTYAGTIPGSNITTFGLKLVLEVQDAFPVRTTDTLYLQVNIPAGAVTYTFDDQHRNRWRMFSLPFDPTTADNAAIGSVLSDLGPEGDFTWRIYRTDSSGINTNYFDSGELSRMGDYGRFEPGNAFWLYVRDDEGGRVPTTTIDFPDLQTVPGDSVTIWLQPGW